MPEKVTSSSQEPAAGQRSVPAPEKLSVVEQAMPKASAAPGEAKPSPAAVMRKLGRLKPILPFLSGGLRMIDHGAIQVIAQLLNLVEGGGGGNTPQPGVNPELQQGLAEMRENQRELSRQVQGQVIETKRIEEQILHLRGAADRSAAQQAELVQQVQSLRNLIRFACAGLAVLLVIVIVLVSLLFFHRG